MIETCLAGRQPGAMFRRTPAASSRKARFMGTSRLDRLARTLTAGSSRRNLLRGLGVPTVGLAALQLPGWVDAKKKKHDSDRKRKRKGKRKKKKNNGESTSPPPTPPASPGPVTTTDARCLSGAVLGGQTGPRLAQTFVAKRSGQLTSASVVLFFNEEGADFELEIREVDVGGTPTSTVLASTLIADVPATGAQTRSILGTFDSPTTVVAGEVYALVVTETTGLNHSFFISGSNTCLDGILFRDELVDGTFDPYSDKDLVYATFVTA